jgi:large subunit ribosomal protein L22
MDVKAKARYVRMSPRKVRLVVDLIRGMTVAEAQSQLKFMKKAAAEPVLKLLNSAVANASHNFNLDTQELYVKSIQADGGPVLGRWRARAFGRAAPIRKRTTHISIVVSEKEKKAPKQVQETVNTPAN